MYVMKKFTVGGEKKQDMFVFVNTLNLGTYLTLLIKKKIT